MEKKYSDKVDYHIKEHCSSIGFMYDGCECAFLKVDYEEHPDLLKTDLEPLGLELMEVFEKYLCEKKFKIVEHSSSFHVMRGDKTYAKIWYDGLTHSQIKSREGAKIVAKKFVELLDDDSNVMGMPQMYTTSCDDFKYHVSNRKVTLAKFTDKLHAKAFIDKHGTKKYNQKIVSEHDYVALLKEDSSSFPTIEIFDRCIGDTKSHKDLLHDLREFIRNNVRMVS